MDKFTPGPWVFVDWKSETPSRFVRSERGIVAYCEGPLPEAQANAKLIAAAPDLLAACERVLQLAVSVGGDEVFAQVRAAVAKAGGSK